MFVEWGAALQYGCGDYGRAELRVEFSFAHFWNIFDSMINCSAVPVYILEVRCSQYIINNIPVKRQKHQIIYVLLKTWNFLKIDFNFKWF